MNSNATQTAPLLLRIVGAIAKWRPTLNILQQVPEGYEDENGFHYGKPPIVEQITWPPAD